MSRTVYLHIGLAKSGTTYVQHLLQANRALLEENGFLFPGPKMSAHFLAALDLSGAALGGHRPEDTEGAWSRITEMANKHSGTTLISHEMLAPIPADVIDKCVRDFDTPDVRIVLTARDFGRQVPAVWQERVKNGSAERYGEFLESIFGSDRARAGGFWRMQYLVDISSRWADAVGADRLTIVTVPKSGADPRELWNRFGTAVELPDLDFNFDSDRANRSLGVAESELLRRLNGHLPELAWPQYVRRVKRRLAEESLAAASTSDRLVVPGNYQQEVIRVAEETIGHVARLGCHVVGDLDDLRPSFPTSNPLTPEAVTDSDLLELALGQLGNYVSRPPTPKPEPAPVEQPRNLLRTLKAGLRGN